MVDWSKIHECEKSKGKIIMIEMDYVGKTHCGYCHELVDYSQVSIDMPARIRDKIYAETVPFGYSEFLELESAFFQLTVSYDSMRETLDQLKKKFKEEK